MGIETIVLGTHKKASNEVEERSKNGNNLRCIKERYLTPSCSENITNSFGYIVRIS